MRRKITRPLKMRSIGFISILCNLLLGSMLFSCNIKSSVMQSKTASEILGNPEYQAISFGGYRKESREFQPTLDQLKEDLRILQAMGINMVRTYNVQLPHASNVVKAIAELQKEDPSFEMYVMLGAWIDCEGAWTSSPNHEKEDYTSNKVEIERAVELTRAYPEIIKVIAVGNEAMVHWAASYFVKPGVILGWVTYLQNLKANGNLPEELWITSSDNFASWGGGGSEYHHEDLVQLAKAVDYVSMHTYPFHDTHYNPSFWNIEKVKTYKDTSDVNGLLMKSAVNYSKMQYKQVSDYLKSIGVDKPIHIGETGWASKSDGFYGPDGSKAADELKQSLYYKGMREWTDAEGISCFYFEAFDEPWKSSANPNDSENHFGLFTRDGKAKYTLWPLVDSGVFEGLSRDGKPITKSYNGESELLNKDVHLPILK